MEAFPVPVGMKRQTSHLNLHFRAYASPNGAVYPGTCFTLTRFILHLFMPSSAGLKVNFCTPAAASRSHLVITPYETRTSRSSKMNLHGQQKLLASGREQVGGQGWSCCKFWVFSADHPPLWPAISAPWALTETAMASSKCPSVDIPNEWIFCLGLFQASQASAPLLAKWGGNSARVAALLPEWFTFFCKILQLQKTKCYLICDLVLNKIQLNSTSCEFTMGNSHL